MKKLSTLLAQRAELLRQARLANLAFAYETLVASAARFARSGLAGRVTLSPAAPDAGRYCATLVALDRSQSVIEEHFTDEMLMDLTDVIRMARDHPAEEITFNIEDFTELFLAPLRSELERAGVAIDTSPVRNGSAR